MNCKQLQNCIQQGESTTLEFKETASDILVEEGLETLSAFINTEGGIVFFGIDDNGIVKGLEENTDEIKQKISSKIKNGFYPSISSLYKLENIICDSVNLIFLKITKENSNLYSYKGNAYIRNGSTTTKLVPQEVIEMRKRLENGVRKIAPNIYTKTGSSVKKCKNCGYSSISGFESILSVGAPPTTETCPQCGNILETN